MKPECECAEEEKIETKEKDALRIVRKNMLWAMGLGAIPLPLVDLVAVTGFQAKALKELSDLYEVPFLRHSVKNILASLLSGFGAVTFGTSLAFSLFKAFPVLGPVATFTATPIMAAALTYATGKVFIQHFESGGTFLSFNPQKVREYFKEQYTEGIKVATEMGKAKTGEGKESSRKKEK